MQIAILPLASIEYHGILPIETDYLIADCISKRLERKLTAKNITTATILPPLPYTTSIEHLGAGPTATAKPETILRLLVELTASIYSSRLAAKAVIYIAFHGGVTPVAYMAARQAMHETKGEIQVIVDSFYSYIERILEKKYGLKTKIIHADPVEASILLACGYEKGVKKTTEKQALLEEIKTQSKYQEPPTPWMHWDIEYPSTPVPASSELGENLIEHYLNYITEKINKLSLTLTII